MSKVLEKKKTWTESPPDAIHLVEYRWYANAIENAAIELFATTGPNAHRITLGILGDCLRRLKDEAALVKMLSVDSCPDGYHLEGNRCVPD